MKWWEAVEDRAIGVMLWLMVISLFVGIFAVYAALVSPFVAFSIWLLK